MLPWNSNSVTDPVSAEYEEESIETDTNEDVSEADELREPLTFIKVDKKFVYYITPQQYQSLCTRQSNPPTSSSITTSIESDIFQCMLTLISNKRK